MNITRVPGSNAIRIEMSEREAQSLFAGIGVLDERQNANLDTAPESAQDAVADLVMNLTVELQRTIERNGSVLPSRKR